MPNNKKKPTVKKRQSAKETFPHFRKYRKSNHPALILAEVNDNKDYLFRRTSHQKSVARKKGYEEVNPNPNPRDPDPMFIEKRKRVDKKSNFYPRPYSWKYKK